MKIRLLFRKPYLITGAALCLCTALYGQEYATPAIDLSKIPFYDFYKKVMVSRSLKVVDIVPVTRSNEEDYDAEPCLTMTPVLKNGNIVVSALSFGEHVIDVTLAHDTMDLFPLYISYDDGDHWECDAIVPLYI